MNKVSSIQAVKISAEMKMAIVDNLSASYRAMVHEIGLSDFSCKHRRVYLAAKKVAGLGKARMHQTQQANATKFLHKNVA